MDERKRKWICWSIAAASFVSLMGLVWAILALIGLGVHGEPGRFGELTVGFIGLVFTLTGSVATRVCRALGVPVDGSVVELLARSSSPSPTGPAGEAAVRIIYRSELRTAGLLSGILALMLSAAGHFRLFTSGPDWMGCALAGLCSVGAAAFCIGGNADAGLVSSVDDGGVTQHSLLKRRTRRIPWEQIGKCVANTGRGAVGRPRSTVCVLYGHADIELLRLDLRLVPPWDRERFLERIQTKLGAAVPSELIAAEAPAGTGTELEAAAMPGGRGTEPIAEVEPVPAGPAAEGTRTGLRERAS